MTVGPMTMPLHHQLAVEQLSRSIDTVTSPDELRQVCRILLQAWAVQRAATEWAMRQSLPQPTHRAA